MKSFRADQANMLVSLILLETKFGPNNLIIQGPKGNAYANCPKKLEIT